MQPLVAPRLRRCSATLAGALLAALALACVVLSQTGSAGFAAGALARFGWGTLDHAGTRNAVPVRMGVVEPGKFKRGQTVEMEDAIWKVVEFQQSKTARQAAVVRAKMKNLLTGATVEKTFRMKETLQTGNLEKRPATYSYEDEGGQGAEYVFYDVETADELRLPSDQVTNGDLMAPGLEVTVLQWGDVVVDVDLPSTVELTIANTEPGLAGDRANPGKKPAELETGASIQVPLFISNDERVQVSTETREYLGRNS